MRLALSLAFLSLLPAAASAQGAPPRERVVSERVIVERRAAPGVVARPQVERVCIPWCSSDTNPCDPPEFKAADGRCARDSY